MEALDVCPARQRLSNLLPVFATIFLNCLSQHEILFLSPVALGRTSMVLIGCLLVLGGASLVQMRVQHLLPQEHLLGNVVGHYLVRAGYE